MRQDHPLADIAIAGPALAVLLIVVVAVMVLLYRSMARRLRAERERLGEAADSGGVEMPDGRHGAIAPVGPPAMSEASGTVDSMNQQQPDQQQSERHDPDTPQTQPDDDRSAQQ